MDIKYAQGYNRQNTRYYAIHHGGGIDNNARTQHLTAEDINAYHKGKWNAKSSLGWYGGYNFYIEKNGKITQFRAVGEETLAQRGTNFNGVAISICLSGNFASDERPTTEQVVALKELLGILPPVQVYNVVPHRILQPDTACYGNLPDDWGRNVYREVIVSKLNSIMLILQKILDILRKRKLGARFLDCHQVDVRG